MKRKARGFSSERNHYFLEFVGVGTLSDTPAPPDPDGPLLWFADLLRYDLLCTGPTSGTEEEVEWKQVYLQSWGYEAEEGEERTPFRTSVIGLLAWPHASGISTFMTAAQERTEGLLFLVEPLFAAATFGLAALDFFTTTGARISELLQVSLIPECLYTLVVEGTQRLLLRLVPKALISLPTTLWVLKPGATLRKWLTCCKNTTTCKPTSLSLMSPFMKIISGITSFLMLVLTCSSIAVSTCTDKPSQPACAFCAMAWSSRRRKARR